MKVSFKPLCKTLGLALTLGLGTGMAGAQTLKPALDLETARFIVDACEQLAREEGFAVVIAVYDQGARLKYFRRMDGSFPLGVVAAQDKAKTSALMPWPTRRVGEIAREWPALERLPDVTGLPGGLPILTAGGAHLGGIGVSGGSGAQDDACAQAGLDAVRERLAD